MRNRAGTNANIENLAVPTPFPLGGRKFERVDGAFHPPPTKLFLADGGVYDNLGIEAVWKTHRTIYVSDAGAAAGYAESGPFLLSTQAMQVTRIMQDQIGALRFRQINAAFTAPRGSEIKRSGFLVRSDFLVDPQPSASPPFERAAALSLSAISTRLSRLDASASARWSTGAISPPITAFAFPAHRRAAAKYPTRIARYAEQHSRRGTEQCQMLPTSPGSRASSGRRSPPPWSARRMAWTCWLRSRARKPARAGPSSIARCDGQPGSSPIASRSKD